MDIKATPNILIYSLFLDFNKKTHYMNYDFSFRNPIGTYCVWNEYYQSKNLIETWLNAEEFRNYRCIPNCEFVI